MFVYHATHPPWWPAYQTQVIGLGKCFTLLSCFSDFFTLVLDGRFFFHCTWTLDREKLGAERVQSFPLSATTARTAHCWAFSAPKGILNKTDFVVVVAVRKVLWADTWWSHLFHLESRKWLSSSSSQYLRGGAELKSTESTGGFLLISQAGKGPWKPLPFGFLVFFFGKPLSVKPFELNILEHASRSSLKGVKRLSTMAFVRCIWVGICSWVNFFLWASPAMSGLQHCQRVFYWLLYVPV